MCAKLLIIFHFSTQLRIVILHISKCSKRKIPSEVKPPLLQVELELHNKKDIILPYYLEIFKLVAEMYTSMNTVLSCFVEPRVELNGQRGTCLIFFSIYVAKISYKIFTYILSTIYFTYSSN